MKSVKPTRVYGIGIALLCAVLVFLFTWSRGKMAGKDAPAIEYEKFASMRVSNHGYGMLATLAVEADASNAEWVKGHRAEVETLLKQALGNADARALQTTGGLAALQTQLKENVNAALPSPFVQQVLITDLVYQSEE